MPRARSRSSAKAAVELVADAREPVGEGVHVAALRGADGDAEQHRRGHEALLRPVVKVALYPPADFVAGFDDSCA